MDNIEKALKTIGLKEKEIKIMLALGAMATLSESNVSRVTKLPRTTIIPILRKLEMRGLVQMVNILGHKRWKIEDFEKIRREIFTAYEAFSSPGNEQKIELKDGE